MASSQTLKFTLGGKLVRPLSGCVLLLLLCDLIGMLLSIVIAMLLSVVVLCCMLLSCLYVVVNVWLPLLLTLYCIVGIVLFF